MKRIEYCGNVVYTRWRESSQSRERREKKKEGEWMKKVELWQWYVS